MTNLRIDLGHSRAIFADFAKSRNLLLRQLVLFRPKIESTKKKVVKRNRRREIYDRKSKRNESRKHSSSRTEEEVGKLGQTLVFLLDGNGLPNQPSFTIFSLDRNVYYFQGFWKVSCTPFAISRSFSWSRVLTTFTLRPVLSPFFRRINEIIMQEIRSSLVSYNIFFPRLF